MPETLTQKMARYQLAIAAGDAAAAQRIAAERIAPPAPRPNPRVATVATYPELAKLTQTDYARMLAELESLRTQNRLLKGQLQQQSAAAYDAQRRLAQLEGAGESSDQE